MTKQEKDDLRLTDIEGGNYVYCSYTFKYVKEVEIIYENNPCSYQKLIIAKYYTEGPACLTLGHEELTPYPIIVELETPKVTNMDKLNVKIGNNNPTSTSVAAEYIQYTSTFEFDVIYESPNYDFMVQLPIEGKKPIFLEQLDSKIYKYLEIDSVTGALAKTAESELTVTLRDAITANELPKQFVLDSTNNLDSVFSNKFTLSEDGKTIKVIFDLTECVTSYEFKLSYISQCNKRIYYEGTTRAAKNYLTSAKYDISAKTVTLTYGDSFLKDGSNKPDKIKIKNKEYTPTTKTGSKKVLIITMTDTLNGIYEITSIYGKESYIETVQLVINGNLKVKPTSEGKSVDIGFNEQWMEITLDNNAFDGLFLINYQKQDKDENILDAETLSYVIDKNNKKILRIYTANIKYAFGYDYYYLIKDLSGNLTSIYHVTVKDNVKITINQHYYKYPATVTIQATGVDYLFAKVVGQRKENTLTKSGNTFTYKPSAKEELVEIYYQRKGENYENKFSEMIFIYENIENIFESSLIDCVYSQSNIYNLNIKFKEGFDTSYLTFKVDDEVVAASYSLSYQPGATRTYRIYDGSFVLYEKKITFSSLEININSVTANGESIEIPISSTCPIKGLQIKDNNELKDLDCDTKKCTYKSKTINGVYYIYYNGKMISQAITPTLSVKVATFLVEYPQIVIPGNEFALRISSKNFDIKKLTAVELTHGDNTVDTFTSDKFVYNGNEIKITLSIKSQTDTITKCKVKVNNDYSDEIAITIRNTPITVLFDSFFSINVEKKLNVKIVSTVLSSGTFTIKSAITDKGLKFEGAECQLNKDCGLQVEVSDYKGKTGKSYLTIE